MKNLEIQTKPSYLYHFQPVHTLQSILIAKISSPLISSRAFLTTVLAIPITKRFCSRCSSGSHSWRKIVSYKLIDSIKKKIIDKCTYTCLTNSKIRYWRQDHFISEDSDRCEVYDCSIKVPLLITGLYGLSLFIRKTFECYPKKK